MKHFAIKLVCKTDKHGNARGGWKVFNENGNLIEFIDSPEADALHANYNDVVILDWINISVVDYNAACRVLCRN